MREILFRGKRLLGNVWINGYYVKHMKRTLYPMGDRLRPDDIVHLIMSDSFSDWGMPREIEAYPVDPSTVGQYTGLVDKNGKMIFEGDIVTGDAFGLPHVVEFVENEYWCAFCAIENGWENGACYGLNEFSTGNGHLNCEIIGNVYDNPEMLEVDHE